ncbi:type VII secretion target [Saccharopolyspora elongata]|uniref:Excreted virulence factor EspC, type VII ESX diderm n=1 Tax=Saccharopolyspora elongata TaxID=2530387 RepID=A0A4R4ZE03_9PSEU|nr:type VII secretion target [Saccharopolyspora elongata]TDD56545.1 hypothetical protein E1288_00155 [Saccharopolyspora elongata]
MPTHDGLKVFPNALRLDAQTWEAASKKIRTAAKTADGLDLTIEHFGFLADELGATAVYQELQEKLVLLLDGAAANSADVSEALEKCASTYERQDEDSATKLSQTN